jgi:hypothetical protein
MYGWVIDKDHLYRDGREYDADESGTMGPRTMTPKHKAALRRGEGVTFTMYDDDGIPYYTGRVVADEMDEAACYGPLGDFGLPNAGAVSIRYPDHPEYDCG